MDPRKLALEAIEKIITKDSFSNIVVNEFLNKYELSNEDKALFTNLVYGTIQHKITIEYYLEPYLKKRQKPWVNNLLLMSIYQIVYLRIPQYAAVNEAVSIANDKSRAIGSFINAVLRNFLRNPLRSFEGLDEISYLSVKYSTPSWLVAFLLKDYKADIVEQILDENTLIRTESYRINTLKVEKQDLLGMLDNNEVFYILSNEAPNCFTPSVSLTNHPLLKEGLITVQDLSSQMVGELSGVCENANVIDLCSAPGGKTAHIAALMKNTGQIYACDIYEHKLKLMTKGFKRLGVKNVKVELLDARKAKDKFGEEAFDFVFADVPCSGLGVMGHKVDIKYHIDLESIAEVENLQEEILNSTCSLVKKGGYYIYSTCTINKDENANQISKFLLKHQEFEKILEKQILPTDYHSDGFYICKLRRKH